MNYENIDKEYLKLLYNPLQNTSLFSSYDRIRYYYSLFLLKTRLFNIFGKNADIKNMVLGEFAKIVTEAEKELEKLISDQSENDTVSLDYKNSTKTADDILARLQKYLTLTLYLHESDKEKLKESTKQFVRTNILATYEYNQSRISERLNINPSLYNFVVDHPNLLLAFYFSEVFYFLVNGDFKATVLGKSIVIEPCDHYKIDYKKYWLSEITEFSSNTADLLNLHTYEDHVRNPLITLENSEVIIRNCLDKVFSLRSDMLSKKLQESEELLILKEVILFSACAEIISNIGNRIPGSYYAERTNIRAKTISLIIDVISKPRKNCSITTISNFVSYENRFFMRGTQSFKLGLKMLVGIIFDENKFDLKDLKGDVGKSFESDYILNYLKKLDYFGYDAHGEFKPTPGDKIEGYDIDLILEDKINNIFFFIQVKYWFSSFPIYLDERIRFFNSRKVKKAVVRQLVTLKENIEDITISNALANIGLANANKENSYFILLHNIPFLNFYEYSGVIFYEWNVLRNLLQDGRVFQHEYKKGKIQPLKLLNTSRKPPFHKPQKLLESYFERDDSFGQSISLNWHLQQKAYNLFKLKNIDFVVKSF